MSTKVVLAHKIEEQSAADSQAVGNQVVVRYSAVWRPPTDIFETATSLIVLMELAGVQDNDFHVVLQNRHLTVSGLRRSLVPSETIACYRLEIPHGEFRVDIRLPWNIRRQAVNASYRNGLLRIELPKMQGHQIQIVNVSSQE